MRYSKPSAGRENFDISSDDISNVDDDENALFRYEPNEPKRTDYFTSSRNVNNKIKVQSYTNLEREATTARNNKSPSSDGKVREVMSADASGDASSPSADRAKDIALNSREIRLVGPNQKEVEMKDDLPTKIVVAMENLGKEATDVWGQVNDKLDKTWTDVKRAEVWGQMNEKLDKTWTDVKKAEVWGQVNEKLDKTWTDLKSMVEGVVAPSNKQQPGRKEN